MAEEDSPNLSERLVDALEPLRTGELADLRDPADVLDSQIAFEGRIWNIRRDRLRFGDDEIVREYVDHPGAVAVLALDEDDRVLLINQYRHPIRSRDWELPAGLLDVPGEKPLDAARRELAEEVDLSASDWDELIAFDTSPGGSDERLTVFRATGLSATEAFRRTAEEAQIVLRWVPLDEVVAAILAGRLRNSILLVAVLAAHAARH